MRASFHEIRKIELEKKGLKRDAQQEIDFKEQLKREGPEKKERKIINIKTED